MIAASPRSRWRRVLLALAGVSFLVLGGADVWVRLSGGRGILVAPTGPSPRWIVVPGASVRRDGSLSPILRDRMETALIAARAWPESRLLLSGTSIPGGYSEPDAMRRWIVARSIGPERLVLDRAGTDTRRTIANLGTPSGDIVIVSQRWHLSRALWTARAEGWSARGLVAPQEGWALRYRMREHAVRILYFLTP